jgi:phosphatidylglycerophosphate synthase
MLNMALNIVVRLHTFLYNYVNILVEALLEINDMYPYVTPNKITYFRTLLLLPIIYYFLHHQMMLCSILVILNDFLDFIDGTVARFHKKKGIIYDTAYGSFIDAACDKIFSIPLWFVLVIVSDLPIGCKTECAFLAIIEGLSLLKRTINYFHYPNIEQSANVVGKAKQTFQMFGSALLFINPNMAFYVLYIAVLLSIKSLSNKFF